MSESSQATFPSLCFMHKLFELDSEVRSKLDHLSRRVLASDEHSQGGCQIIIRSCCTGWDAPGGMCCISRTLRAGSSCCNNSEQTCSSNPPSAQFCAQFSLSATPPGQTRKAACPGLSSVAAWLNWEGSVCLKLVIQP